jgi:hypothetical protein
MPEQTRLSAHEIALAGDTASLQAFRRLWNHYQSELVNDFTAVMPTVVVDENVRGTKIFWAMNSDPEALNAEASAGSAKATIIDGYAGAAGLYESLYRDTVMRDIKVLLQICGGWWVFHQVVMQITGPDGRDADIDCIILVRTDAEEHGVSGELAWVLDGIAPPPAQTATDRLELIRTYARHLGNGDVDQLLAMMADNVQGVVRGHGDTDGRPLLIDGAAQMRDAYANLLQGGTVVEAQPVQWAVLDPRYVFVDLHLRLQHGGEELDTRLVEYFALSDDGRFATRVGWGSPA